MLTLRFDTLGLREGDLILDAGAGFGRHAYAAARCGAKVVALDYASEEVATTRATFAAMLEAAEIAPANYVGACRGDATGLPFADETFDHVVTSEVLEHIQDDVAAIAELARVLKPGGSLGVTVPSTWPERVNWLLSDEYHAPASQGGHVRIYTGVELRAKLRAAGLEVRGSHRAHALHSPYWWLKCAVGPRNDDHRAVAAYRRFLEWDIVKSPKPVRIAETVLNPLLGKSYVVYAAKPRTAEVAQELAAHGARP